MYFSLINQHFKIMLQNYLSRIKKIFQQWLHDSWGTWAFSCTFPVSWSSWSLLGSVLTSWCMISCPSYHSDDLGVYFSLKCYLLHRYCWILCNVDLKEIHEAFILLLIDPVSTFFFFLWMPLPISKVFSYCRQYTITHTNYIAESFRIGFCMKHIWHSLPFVLIKSHYP